MGTLVAVKKGAEVCLATNAWNLREPWLGGSLHATPHCIVKVGESYIGLASSVAFQTCLENILNGLQGKRIPALTSRQELFTFFNQIHETLRNESGMNPSYQPGQEFEWSPMNAIVINRSGIYRVDSSRGVYEFTRYWAYGSGEAFALGAMYASYDQDLSASEIAKKALAASSEFDGMGAIDPILVSIKIPTLVMSERPSSPSTRARREKSKTIKLRPRGSD